jgi:hypothetical protein
MKCEICDKQINPNERWNYVHTKNSKRYSQKPFIHSAKPLIESQEIGANKL